MIFALLSTSFFFATIGASLSGYTAVSDLSTVKSVVSKSLSDLQTLLEVEPDCNIGVVGAFSQQVLGTHYMVQIDTCARHSIYAQIAFFVSPNDAEPTAKDLQLLVTSETAPVMWNNWGPITDFSLINTHIAFMDDSIRCMIGITSSIKYSVVSALYKFQNLNSNIAYKVTLRVEAETPFEKTLTYSAQTDQMSYQVSVNEFTATVVPSKHLTFLDSQIRTELNIGNDVEFEFVAGGAIYGAGIGYQVKLRVFDDTVFDAVFAYGTPFVYPSGDPDPVNLKLVADDRDLESDLRVQGNDGNDGNKNNSSSNDWEDALIVVGVVVLVALVAAGLIKLRRRRLTKQDAYVGLVPEEEQAEKTIV